MATALIIVDPQVDFCPGGALAVAGGDEVMPVINRLRSEIQPTVTVVTQDWHPPNHTSFADNNPGETLFKPRADGQMMWPRHCVQGSAGAEFHPALELRSTDHIVQKGTKADVDSYSGMGAEDKAKERTGLDNILRAANVKRVFVVGLAFDYCVAATAKDAAAVGYSTYVLRNATRAVAPESATKAEAEMTAAGVLILSEYALDDLTRVHEQRQAQLVELQAGVAKQHEKLQELLDPSFQSAREAAKRRVAARRSFWRRLFCLA